MGGEGLSVPATLSGEHAGWAGPRLETLELHLAGSVAEPSGALGE